MKTARRSPTLLSNRDFLRLWAAQAGSAIGSRISRTAFPVIAVLVLANDTEQVAFLSAVSVLPAILVGTLISGKIERAQKQRVMLVCDLLRAGLLLVVPVAAFFGWLNIWILDAIAFLQGAATSAFRIADASFLPVIVEESFLVEGNAKFESTDAVAEAAGPAIAGFLIQFLGASGAVLIDAASYLWSAFWLGRISQSRHAAKAPETAPQSMLADIVIGWRTCVSTPLLAAMLSIEVLTSLSNGFFMALYMLLALRQLGLSPGAVGLIVSVGGISSLCAALLAPALTRRFALLPLLVSCLVLGQGADFLIAIAPSSGHFAPALLVGQQLLGDGFCTLYAIYAIAARQRLLDVGVLARSHGTFQIASGVAMPFGALIAGITATHLGIQVAMVIAGAVGVASALTLLPAVQAARQAGS